MAETTIYQVTSDENILRCKRVVQDLRPHISDDEYLERIKRQLSNGYMMICLFEGDVATSFAGFRINEMLMWGRALYIDDLGTLPEHRKKGYGGMLLDWIFDYAKEQQCDEVHLDSGVHRFDAHRLYLNKGFIISSHHFAKK